MRRAAYGLPVFFGGKLKNQPQTHYICRKTKSMRIESRIGRIGATPERVYTLISDFSRINSTMLPQNDKIKDVEATPDSCTFTIDKAGRFGMRIVERNPYKLLKIESAESPLQFKLWIQLKEYNGNESAVKVTLDADVNALMSVMVKKPLTEFVETLVSKMETIR